MPVLLERLDLEIEPSGYSRGQSLFSPPEGGLLHLRKATFVGSTVELLDPGLRVFFLFYFYAARPLAPLSYQGEKFHAPAAN